MIFKELRNRNKVEVPDEVDENDIPLITREKGKGKKDTIIHTKSISFEMFRFLQVSVQAVIILAGVAVALWAGYYVFGEYFGTH